MKTRRNKYLIILFLISFFSKAQTTLFTENFESYGTFQLTGATANWRMGQITASVNNWYVMNSGSAACVITGNNSLLVGTTTGPAYCTYTNNDNCNKIAYPVNTINAVGYCNLTMTFNWKCMGETPSYDYLKIYYSFDAITWTQVSATIYNGQSGTQAASIALPAACNNTSFYIGFDWVNDGSLSSGNPGAVVDDIVITAASTGPTNDLCANAVNLGTVSTSTTTTGDNTCASTSAGDPTPSCWFFGVNDNLWYKFTTPASAGSAVISLVRGTMTYASVTLFSGACGAFSEVACTDAPSSTSNSTINICGLAANTTYYIEVWDDAGTPGTFSLSVTFNNTANDACAGAIPLTLSTINNSVANTITYSVSTVGSNVCATSDATSSNCFTSNRNVWYTFSPPVTGNYFVGVQAGTISYPEVSILTSTGACSGTWTEYGCGGPTQFFTKPYGYYTSTYSFAGTCNLAAGTTYYVMVDDNSSPGTFTLNIVSLSNDDIGQAGIIASCGTSFSSSTMGATNCGSCTNSFGGWSYANVDCNNSTTNGGTTCFPGCPGTGGDVDYSVENDSWYQVCSTTAQTYSLTITPNTCYYGSGVQMSIFTGSSGNLTWVNGTPHAGVTAATTYTFNLAANGCIYIQTDGLSGSLCDYSLVLNGTPGCNLPLELLSFTGEHINNSKIKLDWVLASEKDISYYIIEKSATGNDYVSIGKVTSAGNTTVKGSYYFYDNQPLKGYNYYRLSAIDKNGVQNITAHTMVTNSSHLPYFSVYPNPSTGMVTINAANFSSPVIDVEIYDAYGKQVWLSKINLDNGQHIADLSFLSGGLYFVKAGDGTNFYKQNLVISKNN